MPLESLSHTEHLHRVGLEEVKNISNSLPASAIALCPEEAVEIPSPSLFNFHGTSGKDGADEGTENRPAAPAPRKIGDMWLPEPKSKDLKNWYNRLPTVAECAAHLELLEAFYVVRQKILISTEIDHAMGIKPNRETKKGKKGDTKTFKDETFWERRQEKWHRYLEFACVRFLAWADALTIEDTVVIGKEPRALKHLPPLDILMVWHSYLLNPKLFYEKCAKKPIWRISLPWEAIHAAIDSDDWTFELDAEDANAYRKRSSLPPDLYKSFCEWNPPLSGSSYRQDSSAVPEPAALPLTSFSFKTSVITQKIEAPHNTFMKKATATYCDLFRSANLGIAKKLKEAVIRQTNFIDKMNAQLWIRSPAVEGTLRRAIKRYDQFLGILKANKNFMIVPTLDVDLVWHTNQCYSGLGYAITMKERVTRFINHDDTIAKDTLGDGFSETRKQWRLRYGKEYNICGCWDCEALISAVEKAASASELEAIVGKVGQEVRFYRVCELRRRKKLPLPKKGQHIL